MISSLGFIPNSSERTKLKKFIPDPEIKEKLSYLEIPLIDQLEQNSTDSESEEKILETDSIVFATPNTEEISSLAFHVYNEDTIFCHHDLFVFSTIFDSAYIQNDMVALATYENDIFIYDSFTRFPVLPQKLLSGHEATVTGIKYENERLLSCSEDKTVIEWDLEKMCIKNRNSYDMPIDRFDFHDCNLAFGTNDYLNINNESFNISGNIEKIKINENFVYVLDSDGNVIVYDLRSLHNSVFEKNIHKDAVFDIAFYQNKIVTCSMDKTVKVWENPLDFDMKARYEKKDVVYCIGFDSNGKLFCGDEENNVTSITIN